MTQLSYPVELDYKSTKPVSAVRHFTSDLRSRWILFDEGPRCFQPFQMLDDFKETLRQSPALFVATKNKFLTRCQECGNQNRHFWPKTRSFPDANQMVVVPKPNQIISTVAAVRTTENWTQRSVKLHEDVKTWTHPRFAGTLACWAAEVICRAEWFISLRVHR